MKQNCQHCGELIVGNSYRVRSEEAGITLIDMIVCSRCSMEAKKLRLHTKKMNVTSKQVLARTRGTYPFTTRYLM
jgi:ribosome-binding protein aMBF1 (putative translation factor)